MPTFGRQFLEQVGADGFHVLGIDPAPSKKSAVWESGGARKLGVLELADFLQDRLRKHGSLVIVWDSPLSFESQRSFSDRLVDKGARSWVKEGVRAGRLEKGAVSVLPFSSCSHWPVSCFLLGLPFGRRPQWVKIAGADNAAPSREVGVIFETHPALALASLWVETQGNVPFPKYKGRGTSREVPARIAADLRFPADAGKDADVLDAYVGWLLGTSYVGGKALQVGDPTMGSYLLPAGEAADEIQRRHDRLASAASGSGYKATPP